MVMQPYCGLEDNEITHIERYLDVKRSELLFSKSVILVEGDAEEILIPIMVKKCFGVSLDELGISLINIGSVGFENIYKLFHNQRIQKKCAVITDLDTPINVSDSSQQNAYERGKNRKKLKII
jgi:putative ATP-dependent endonuclease of the OLD family